MASIRFNSGRGGGEVNEAGREEEEEDSLSRIRENRNLARLECVFEYLRGFREARNRRVPRRMSVRGNETNEEGRMTRFGKRKSIINSPLATGIRSERLSFCALFYAGVGG